MVNSFSEFAKMPDADVKNEDIMPVIKDVFVLNKQAHSNVKITLHSDFDHKQVIIPHDDQQIRQLMTNLIKNAVEAMEDADIDDKRIAIIMVMEHNRLIIGVADNGPGLPGEVENDKLSEPYVTHKEKGTGLGLAIVKKIVEDHQGDLMFNPDIPSITPMNINYSTLIAFSIPLIDESDNA